MLDRRPVRIANCSGYSGDRREAIREILDGGPVDVITGDYLAELTIAASVGRRMRGRGEGYSEWLLLQLDGCFDEILDRGIRLVVNAGGFAPGELAERLRELASGGRRATVAHLEGDDVLGRLDELQRAGHALEHLDSGAPLTEWGRTPSSANAYLGGWGIADALAGGVDVVVCGRVTDASLAVGPAAWWHGWGTEDWDRLAGAVVAGHVIECGPQATGGNYSGFTRIADLTRPGFPIAEIESSGEAIITKHPGTGGAVDRDTVTAQLMYEIQGATYLNPDVTVDLATVRLEDEEPDRVRISATRGTAPPPTTKVAITAATGWENSFHAYLCGLDLDAKAALVEAQTRDLLAGTEVEIVRVERIGAAAPDPETMEEATVTLRFVGRASSEEALKPSRFFRRVHQSILASIPGFHADGATGRATQASPLFEYWPALLPMTALDQVVVHDDGTRVAVRAVPSAPLAIVPGSEPGEPGHGADEDVAVAPLGRIAYARAGDKGGNSNVGVWAPDPAAWPWLRDHLSTERIRQLVPEAAGLEITRHQLPELRAVHFVFHGLLGDGATSNARHDALGKSVGEFLRARHVEVPRALLHDPPTTEGAPTMATSYVLPFDDEASGTHDLVGGKGANLGLLARAGFPVPPGFTVTTAAYQRFLDSGGLRGEIERLVGGLAYDSADELERVTASIRELITGRPMPEEIAAEIAASYDVLGDDAYVAVRSSGTAEDLADASFAGMHDTYLDIMGADAVLDAVKRCWASLWTARAASYRDTRGFEHSAGIAVVVQAMVPSEIAGVMFTANPLTAATDEIVINASWGLGEAIVSGIATPDDYVVRHRDLHVIERTAGSKEQRVVRDPATGVGTVVEEVPPGEREQLTLSDEQVARLADLGRRVQAHYGDFPQDTEWGCAGGEFLLLQSRPVTGVELSWDADVDGWQWQDEAPDDNVWTRAWSDNIWNGAVTPLMYSFRARCFTQGSSNAQTLYGETESAQLRMWKYYKAGVYYNCALEKNFVSNTAFPAIRPGLLENLPPAWHEEVLAAPLGIGRYLKLQARLQFLDPMHGVASWRKQHDYYLEEMKEAANGIPDEQLRRLSDRALVRYTEEIFRLESQYIFDVWSAFFIQARDAFGLLGTMLAKWYDGPRATVFTDLITGVPRPTAAMVETYELWKLARAIRDSEALTRTFKGNEGSAFFEAAGDSEEGRAWLAQYDAFMAEHRHRGHADRDIYYLRRSEDPGVDYRALAAFLSADRADDPAEQEAAVEQRRQAVIEEVAENLRSKSFGGLRVELFKATLDYVMTFLLFRDDERHWVDRTTFSIKRGYKEIGHRLRERGLLEGERDYFFLTGQELYAMLEGRANVPLAHAKVAARMRNFDRIDRNETSNPMYIVRGRDADLEYDRVPGEELPDGVFRGIGTSGGTIEGTARVVKELTDIGRVQHGEILVTNSTDPGWTPVFLVINGIVLETGGMLAHGSCLAREYGMPAVQLPKAMLTIPDGSTIRLNGDAGTIEVLDAPVAAEAEPEPVPA